MQGLPGAVVVCGQCGHNVVYEKTGTAGWTAFICMSPKCHNIAWVHTSPRPQDRLPNGKYHNNLTPAPDYKMGDIKAKIMDDKRAGIC